jgi:hypothetical protein
MTTRTEETKIRFPGSFGYGDGTYRERLRKEPRREDRNGRPTEAGNI